MRTKKGIVSSTKMQNTVTVTVTREVLHPKYHKRYPLSKNILADTDGKEVHEGDAVLIGETRPLSKRKHFKVLTVLARGMEKAMSLEEEMRGMSERKSGAADTLIQSHSD